MTPKLKPCPFCGKNAIYRDEYTMIHCSDLVNCCAEMSMINFNPAERKKWVKVLIDNWNTRYKPRAKKVKK